MHKQSLAHNDEPSTAGSLRKPRHAVHGAAHGAAHGTAATHHLGAC